MSTADAGEAGRALAAKRWDPSPVVARAVQTVVDRRDELDADQLAELRRVTDAEARGDG